MTLSSDALPVSRRALALSLAIIALPIAASGQTLQPRVIELQIKSREVHGPEVRRTGRSAGAIRLVQGETIELAWTSDERVTLHLHGYNVETKLDTGSKGTMRFQARAAGRFPIETHGIGSDKSRHQTLLYVEVHPR